jgi:hypothetical protein
VFQSLYYKQPPAHLHSSAVHGVQLYTVPERHTVKAEAAPYLLLGSNVDSCLSAVNYAKYQKPFLHKHHLRDKNLSFIILAFINISMERNPSCEASNPLSHNRIFAVF